MHSNSKSRSKGVANIDVTNPMTGESLQRIQWSRDKRTITVYTNFGVWKVFTGRQAQMVNQAFINAMNQIEREMSADGDDQQNE